MKKYCVYADMEYVDEEKEDGSVTVSVEDSEGAAFTSLGKELSQRLVKPSGRLVKCDRFSITVSLYGDETAELGVVERNDDLELLVPLDIIAVMSELDDGDVWKLAEMWRIYIISASRRLRGCKMALKKK